MTCLFSQRTSRSVPPPWCPPRRRSSSRRLQKLGNRLHPSRLQITREAPVGAEQLGQRQANGLSAVFIDLNRVQTLCTLANCVGIDGSSFVADYEGGFCKWDQRIIAFHVAFLVRNAP